MSHHSYFDDSGSHDTLGYLGVRGGGGAVGLEGGAAQYSYFNLRPSQSEGRSSSHNAEGHYEAPMAATLRYEEPQRFLQRDEFQEGGGAQHAPYHQQQHASASPSKANKYKFTRAADSETPTPAPAPAAPVPNNTTAYRLAAEERPQQRQPAAATAPAPQHTPTATASSSGSVSAQRGHAQQRHPTLEEVQRRLREVDAEHRLEARRRLQASDAKRERLAVQQQLRANEAAERQRYEQGADLGEYAASLGRVGSRPVPHEASLGAAVLSAARQRSSSAHNGHHQYQQRQGPEEYVPGRHQPWNSNTSVHNASHQRSVSASPPQQQHHRSASMASAITTDDPLLPVGKRIDPNDVFFKPAQGRLQSMIENRNNAHDVDSYSRFHRTAATAAAGGRHDGIVAGAAPTIPANLRALAANMGSGAASSSLSPQPSNRGLSSSRGGGGGGTVSTIEAYTREVEAAQIRRLKGQAAIISAHQRGDPRALHYDPLMVVRPVEWKERDPTVLHGAVPRATLLRQQHTAKKLQEQQRLSGGPMRRGGVGAGRRAASAGGLTRSTNGSASGLNVSAMRAAALGIPQPLPNTFGTSPSNAFAAHPMGFAELPSRSKRAEGQLVSSAAATPQSSAPPSPMARGFDDPSGVSPSQSPSQQRRRSESPRYVLSGSGAALFAAVQPAIGATGVVGPMPNPIDHNKPKQQQQSNPNTFTVEVASNVASVPATADGSVISDTPRLTVPSEALIAGTLGGSKGAAAGNNNSADGQPPLGPLRPHDASELPFRSKKSASMPRADEAVAPTASASASAGNESGSEALVRQLLEQQAAQQRQIERLLKAQEALLLDREKASTSVPLPPQQQQQKQRSGQRSPTPPGGGAAVSFTQVTAKAPVAEDPMRYTYYRHHQHQQASGSSAAPRTQQQQQQQPPYVSPSRSLLMHEFDASPTPQPQQRQPSQPSQHQQALPHAWWERHSATGNSPDAHAPPLHRDRTSSPNHNGGAGIAAAFAAAVASAASASTPRQSAEPYRTAAVSSAYYSSGGGAAALDEALTTALSPMSEEPTPSPAAKGQGGWRADPSSPSPQQYASSSTSVAVAYPIGGPQPTEQRPPSPRRGGSAVPFPAPAPIPQAVFDSGNAKRQAAGGGNTVGYQQQQGFSRTLSGGSAPEQRSRSTSSVGAIAQLFRSGSLGSLNQQQQQQPRGASQPIGRGDLFQPRGASAAATSAAPSASAVVNATAMSFREAFDSGAPLPYERPAGGLSPEQPVAYYADDAEVGDGGLGADGTPEPNDPATMLLMQMAGQRRAMAS